MIVHLPNPVPLNQCSLPLIPVNHSVPSPLSCNLFLFASHEDTWPWFLHIHDNHFHFPYCSHTPLLMLIPRICIPFPICTFAHVLLFLLDDGWWPNLLCKAPVFILPPWESSIGTPLLSWLTHIWTQIQNFPNMDYSLWRELYSYEYPGAHKTMDIIAFIRYNPPAPHWTTCYVQVWFHVRVLCVSQTVELCLGHNSCYLTVHQIKNMPAISPNENSGPLN